MKTVRISQGYECFVDDEDYERVAALKWTADIRPLASGSKYIIARRQGYNGTKRTSFGMHHFVFGIMPWETNFWLDHIDRNALNNQKYNLKLATPKESGQNTSFVINASHIHFDTARAKWMVMFKHKYYGRFDSKTEALAVAEKLKCA